MLTGDNGLLNKTTEARIKTEIAQVEEEARLIYTEYLIGNKANNEALADLETIYNYSNKNFTMKKDTQGTETINGIKTNLTPDLTSETPEADTFTFLSDDTSTKTITISKDSTSSNGTKYYAVVNGKDYEMTLTNGTINISRTPVVGGGNSGATLTNVTAVASPASGVVNVSTSGNVVSITRDTSATSGTATITITGTINGTTYTKVAKVSIRSFASNDSKVGYYADLNGDGEISLEDDGIIFADLYQGASGTGLGQSYSLTAVTSGLKNYEESTTTLTGDVAKFGNQKWIKEADGTTGKNRFYVMALKDIDTSYHYWYYNAFSLINNASDKSPYLITEEGIGIDSNNKAVGRKNTEAVMAKFNKTTTNGGWGVAITGQSYNDMFEVITTKYNSSIGWFVPSKQEWTAFAGATMVGNKNVRDNYSSFGLNNNYWSSSQDSSNPQYAWSTGFDFNFFGYGYLNGNTYVRLCTTF